MDKAIIMEFAGNFLSKYKHLTAPALQKFIMNRDEVGKAVSIEDIEDSLSMLYCGKFIKIIHSSEDGTVYVKDRD